MKLANFEKNAPLSAQKWCIFPDSSTVHNIAFRAMIHGNAMKIEYNAKDHHPTMGFPSFSAEYATGDESGIFPRVIQFRTQSNANAILARAQALLWVRDCA